MLLERRDNLEKQGERGVVDAFRGLPLLLLLYNSIAFALCVEKSKVSFITF